MFLQCYNFVYIPRWRRSASRMNESRSKTSWSKMTQSKVSRSKVTQSESETLWQMFPRRRLIGLGLRLRARAEIFT